MGSFTYGSAGVGFSRSLTEEEHAAWLLAIAEAQVSEEYMEDTTFRLADAVDINGMVFGDIITVNTQVAGFDLEAGGKVYSIANVIQAMIDELPEDVTADGEGMFETDGDHWGVLVEDRTVKERSAAVFFTNVEGKTDAQVAVERIDGLLHTDIDVDTIEEHYYVLVRALQAILAEAGISEPQDGQTEGGSDGS